MRDKPPLVRNFCFVESKFFDLQTTQKLTSTKVIQVKDRARYRFGITGQIPESRFRLVTTTNALLHT